jgi:hypothetical protein
LIVSVLASVWIGARAVWHSPASAYLVRRHFLLAVDLPADIDNRWAGDHLIANGLINIFVASPLQMSRMFSARLGIATMAICPVIVSVSVETINRLMRHVFARGLRFSDPCLLPFRPV